jgi:hypothetical protein
MDTQVEELDGDTVRLTVDVPAHDVHHAVEHATSDLASSVKIPGFRAGKVPTPVLVKRIGKERIYAEAVDSHISGWFWNAAATTRIRPVEQPRYEYELPDSDDAARRYADAYERLLGRPEQRVLVVCHEIPVRYAINAALGSDNLDAPAHGIGNCVPHLFDEDGLSRAVERMRLLS